MSTKFSRLTAVALAAGTMLAGASSAHAGTSISAPQPGPVTFWGLNVTFTVSSDTPGPITIHQVRADNLQGPGQCLTRGDRFNDNGFAAPALRTIDYPTAGVKVKVSIPAARLLFKGGDPKAATYPDPGGTGGPCRDFVTTYNRIAAGQPGAQGWVGAERKLTRLF